MPRKLATASRVSLLALTTLSVVWAGLNWPPPLWIVEYGMPGSQGPTGRVARIEGIEFVEVEPGISQIGNHARCYSVNCPGRFSSLLGISSRPAHVSSPECAPHWIRFLRPFWLARREISCGELDRFGTGHRKDEWAADRDPVTYISPSEARAYCAWLRMKSGLPVRLPSEAEWTCAAQAGREERWTWTVYSGRTFHFPPEPNGWGFWNMWAQAREICLDAWWPTLQGGPPDGSPRTRPPPGVLGPPRHVSLGGDRGLDHWGPVQLRHAIGADEPLPWTGFRPAFTLAPDQEHLVEPYLVEGKK